MSRDAVRRALLHASLEVENLDAEAIPSAITWTTRALWALFELQATLAPPAPPATEKPLPAGPGAGGAASPRGPEHISVVLERALSGIAGKGG